ncbi:MAG: hypothetical protein RIF41_01555 [Polyangiaceae bacterium]
MISTSTNVEAEFQDALAKVRGDALPCSYEVPEQVTSGEVSLGLVNVEITDPGGDPATVPFDPSCNGVGWHFDDQQNPTSIELCGAS